MPKSNSSQLDNHPPKPTDSAWFWLSLFLAGAAVALVLSGPKYSWRQPQLERQYQARQRSGATVPAYHEPDQLSQTGQPTIIGLRPLKLLVVFTLVLSTICFWMFRFWQWRQVRIEPRINTS